MGSDWSVSTREPAARRWRWRSSASSDEHAAGDRRFLPDERLDLVDALAGFTLGSAWVNHLDAETGSIEVGKAADLAVLDRDLFDRGAGAIGEARVVATFIDGEAVYEDPSSTADRRVPPSGRWTHDDGDSGSDVGGCAGRASRCWPCTTEPIRGRRKERPSERHRRHLRQRAPPVAPGRGPTASNGLAGPASAASAIGSLRPRRELRRTLGFEASGPASRRFETIPSRADLLLSALASSLHTRRPPLPPAEVFVCPGPSGQARSASVSMSRSVVAVRVESRASRLRDDRRRQRSAQRPEAALAPGEQRGRRRQARLATEGHRQRPAAAVVLEDDARSRPTRRAARPSTARTGDRQRRHVAADDEDRSASARRRAPRAARRADLRTRPRRGPASRPAGRAGLAPGAATTMISVAIGRTASIAWCEQRSTVERLGELVAAEPARPAAGQDDDADPGDRHERAAAAAGARDPGT